MKKANWLMEPTCWRRQVIIQDWFVDVQKQLISIIYMSLCFTAIIDMVCSHKSFLCRGNFGLRLGLFLICHVSSLYHTASQTSTDQETNCCSWKIKWDLNMKLTAFPFLWTRKKQQNHFKKKYKKMRNTTAIKNSSFQNELKRMHRKMLKYMRHSRIWAKTNQDEILYQNL